MVQSPNGGFRKEDYLANLLGRVMPDVMPPVYKKKEADMKGGVKVCRRIFGGKLDIRESRKPGNSGAFGGGVW